MPMRPAGLRTTCFSLALAALGLACGGGPETRNVVLVTLDGVRIQDFFAGIDPAIAAHSATLEYSDIEAVKQRYWRETPTARREAVMPFFWKTLAPMGVVLGNKAAGSSVTVTNQVCWSSAGYAEIMTGAAQPEIVDNSLVRYPHETVIEYVRKALDLDRSQVAEFGSWDGIKMAAASRDGAFFMNGAFDGIPADLSTPHMDRIAALRHRVLGLWEEGSNDALTFELAKAYLQRHQPRLLWIAFGQTDDWAHADRYDRLIEDLHLMDTLLEDLWTTMQSMDAYRDRTTLIITTDHGRGREAQDWAEHDIGIPGSEDIWVAVIGPDTPDVGELAPAPPAFQSNIAATLLQFFDHSGEDFSSRAGPPIPGTLD